MTPLDRISQLTDENAQLRAALARVTAERDRWVHEYSEKYDETRDLRARVAELLAALREEKRIHPEDFQQGDFRERALAAACAETAAPAKHPDTKRLVALLESAQRSFKAMPEANPSHTRDGIWGLWADGCNALGYAIDAARKQGTA